MILDFGDENVINFFKALQNRKVEYMLIGGWAVNYHGYVRATQDLDIWIAPTNENKLVFCAVLIDIGYTEAEIVDIKQQDFTQHFMCKVWLENNMSVDCLTYVHKDIDFFLAQKEMRTFFLVENVQVNVVSYEFLKDMKTRAKRFKDLEDISKLEEIRSRIK